MTNDNNIKNFTASDIEKYHKGLLTPQQMHALEKAALDDPFLADALEGYAVAGVNADKDIDELEKRLAEKTEKAKIVAMHPTSQTSFPWLRAAIILILIAGAGLIAFQLLYKSKVRPGPIAAAPKSGPAKTTSPASREFDSVTPSAQSQTNTDLATSINQAPGDLSHQQSATVPNPVNDKRIKDSLAAKQTEARYRSEDVASNISPSQAERKDQLEVTAGETKTVVADSTKADVKSDKDKVAGLEKKPTASNGYGVFPTSKDRAIAQKSAPADYANTNFSSTVNTFRGRVTDANNNALPFANITNSRDNVGTYSDAQGNFTLLSGDSVLNVQVRSLGFTNKNVLLNSTAAANRVTLQEDRNLPVDTLDKVKRNIRRNRNNSMTLEDPEPEDGWDSYSSYVMNNLNIPESYDVKQAQAGESSDNSVEVSFEVNKNGEPVNIKIEKSLCDRCDAEAKRLIKDGPKWKRKTKKSKRATLTIPFIK